MATLVPFCADAYIDADTVCDCPALDQLDEAQQTLVKEMAAQIVHSLLGSRFGPCLVTVRPCSDTRVTCGRCGGGGSWTPRCSCDYVSEIVLPGPVYAIEDIIVDGETVDPDTYRVDDYAWLVNLDGSWQWCQDMAAQFDEEGAFSVQYYIGMPPPKGADLVTATLACELAKSICGDSGCALPKAVSSKTRQGITITYDDFEAGRVGIPWIDLWFSSVNKPVRQSRVFSPDWKDPRRTTWTNTSP